MKKIKSELRTVVCPKCKHELYAYKAEPIPPDNSVSVYTYTSPITINTSRTSNWVNTSKKKVKK